MDEGLVHSRIYQLFPLLYVNGWKYKGVKFSRGKFHHIDCALHFHKTFANKLGGCAVPVSYANILAQSFNLRGHIEDTLAKADQRLNNRRLMESEAAA